MALRAALGASHWRVAGSCSPRAWRFRCSAAWSRCVAGAGVPAIRTSVPPDITKWVAGWARSGSTSARSPFALLVALAPPSPPACCRRWAAARLALVDACATGARRGGGGRGAASLIVVGADGAGAGAAGRRVLWWAASAACCSATRASIPRACSPSACGYPIALSARASPWRRSTTRLLPELAAAPGVGSAAAVAQLPGRPRARTGGAVSIQGRNAPGDLDLPMADYQPASADTSRRSGCACWPGALCGAETAPTRRRSRSSARAWRAGLWPGGSALGQPRQAGPPGRPGALARGGGRRRGRHAVLVRQGAALDALPAVRAGAARFDVRAGAAARATPALAPALRARVAALDPELPLDELRTLAPGRGRRHGLPAPGGDACCCCWAAWRWRFGAGRLRRDGPGRGAAHAGDRRAAGARRERAGRCAPPCCVARCGWRRSPC